MEELECEMKEAAASLDLELDMYALNVWYVVSKDGRTLMSAAPEEFYEHLSVFLAGAQYGVELARQIINGVEAGGAR